MVGRKKKGQSFQVSMDYSNYQQQQKGIKINESTNENNNKDIGCEVRAKSSKPTIRVRAKTTKGVQREVKFILPRSTEDILEGVLNSEVSLIAEIPANPTQKNKSTKLFSKEELQRKAMKLNMTAMKGIASKLYSQMEPGHATFKNGVLPILSVAQIDKAVKQKLGVKKAAQTPSMHKRLGLQAIKSKPTHLLSNPTLVQNQTNTEISEKKDIMLDAKYPQQDLMVDMASSQDDAVKYEIAGEN